MSLTTIRIAIHTTLVAALSCATLAIPARAGSVAPPPCVGSLPLYTRIGTLANANGSHPRAADVEGRLAILRYAEADGVAPRAARVGYAYVDGEGDLWIQLDPGNPQTVADWKRAAPGSGRHVPAYALIERVGIPRGYRFSACGS